MNRAAEDERLSTFLTGQLATINEEAELSGIIAQSFTCMPKRGPDMHRISGHGNTQD